MIQIVDESENLYKWLKVPPNISVGDEILPGVTIAELYPSGAFKTSSPLPIQPERVLIIDSTFIYRGMLLGSSFLGPNYGYFTAFHTKATAVLCDEHGQVIEPPEYFKLISIFDHGEMLLWVRD